VNASEWERLLLEATTSVRKAVSPLAGRMDRGRTVGVGASGDKTIVADKKAEDLLLRYLQKAKGVKILSEEAGSIGGSKSNTLAVVDPLDGSSNFARGIPFYCTSVAIVEGSSIEDTSVGVVRDLLTGDVYHAVKGRGAKKNGKPIRTSETSELSKAVIGVDLSGASSALVSGLAPLISGAKRHVHLGANALELCLVADGTIDAFVDARERIRVTDFAAAFLIAKEAGAAITNAAGGSLNPKFDLEHRFSFVGAANVALHDEILKRCRTLPPMGGSNVQ